MSVAETHRDYKHTLPSIISPNRLISDNVLHLDRKGVIKGRDTHPRLVLYQKEITGIGLTGDTIGDGYKLSTSKGHLVLPVIGMMTVRNGTGPDFMPETTEGLLVPPSSGEPFTISSQRLLPRERFAIVVFDLTSREYDRLRDS